MARRDNKTHALGSEPKARLNGGFFFARPSAATVAAFAARVEYQEETIARQVEQVATTVQKTVEVP